MYWGPFCISFRHQNQPPQTCYIRPSLPPHSHIHHRQRFNTVVNNAGWPGRLGHYKNKATTQSHCRPEQKKSAVFGIPVPNPSIPKVETQEKPPSGHPSAALRAEMCPLWPLCQHSFILRTRQHLCYSVWAASQHYGNFKAPCHHLNAHYSSFPREDFLQHQTTDNGWEDNGWEEDETEDTQPLSRNIKDFCKVNSCPKDNYNFFY